jgi:CheY-like chemotaxis protein
MTGGRILYIEDNFENRILIKRVLESEGYTVIEAETGKAGLSTAEKLNPDLILMDINLPDIDGYDCTALLRKLEKLGKVPIVALTANVMEGDRQRALDAGLDGYIPKPIDIDSLPGQIAAFLKGEGEHRVVIAAGSPGTAPAPSAAKAPPPPPPVRIGAAPPPPPPPVGSAPRPPIPARRPAPPPPPPTVSAAGSQPAKTQPAPPQVAANPPVSSPPPPPPPVSPPVRKPVEDNAASALQPADQPAAQETKPAAPASKPANQPATETKPAPDASPTPAAPEGDAKN